jgi:hypothetical protein
MKDNIEIGNSIRASDDSNDIRRLRSLEIAAFASGWTMAIIFVTVACIFGMLKLFGSPVQTVSPPAVLPGAVEKFAPEVEAVAPIKIPLSFEFETPDLITVPFRANLESQPDEVIIPVKVKIKRLQAAAEHVEVETPGEHPTEKPPTAKPKPATKKYSGVGIPPKEGDPLDPPKGLSNAERRRIRSPKKNPEPAKK